MSTLPEPPARSPFDVAIVGLVVVVGRDMTMETQEVLSRCRPVFMLDNGYGIDPHLSELGPEVISLNTLYHDGQLRRQTYRQMAAEVLSAATSEPSVAFASYGHPKVFCYPTTFDSESLPAA
jgi:uncharacterized protein YabN with tetrapyrrole methylase and pyrophosphatase domain